MRFEAVLGKTDEKLLKVVIGLNLDWLPATDGIVRVLLTADDAVKLLEHGIEVRLVRAYPVRPMDPKLVMDDEAAEAWLERATASVRRGGKS
jgi:hypothetical protein